MSFKSLIESRPEFKKSDFSVYQSIDPDFVRILNSDGKRVGLVARRGKGDELLVSCERNGNDYRFSIHSKLSILSVIDDLENDNILRVVGFEGSPVSKSCGLRPVFVELDGEIAFRPIEKSGLGYEKTYSKDDFLNFCKEGFATKIEKTKILGNKALVFYIGSNFDMGDFSTDKTFSRLKDGTLCKVVAREEGLLLKKRLTEHDS